VNVLGIDPGREKMGLAVVSATADVLWRSIIAPRELATVLPGVLKQWNIGRIALGHSTASSKTQFELSTVLGQFSSHLVEVVIVDETGSTLEARQLYWEALPPVGWRRLMPLSMQVPPVPLDDFAAAVIARRSL
jgi:RNase H-fold protein (predicted Holliday junction resolvase)